MSQKLCLLWLFTAFTTHPFLPHDQDIVYNGFHLAKDYLTLNGVAQIDSNGILKLTNSKKRSLGHAFYRSLIRIKESPSSAVQSFSTLFAFSIVPELQTHGGHGLAFVIALDKQHSGARHSQFLGLMNSSCNGNPTNHAFVVEFDTFISPRFKDINSNHVGIDINSLSSVSSVVVGYYVDGNSTFQDLNLRSGVTIYAWIDYDSCHTRCWLGFVLLEAKH